MKKYRISKSAVCVLFAVLFMFVVAISAYAVDIDGDGIDDGDIVETEVYTDPEYTEPYTEPETYPETEPVYTEEPTEPYYEETTEYDFNNNVVNETVSPTQLSTSKVSTKRYETNDAAGVVYWVCVIVGIIVLIFVLLSTKISYALERRREQRDIYSS